MYTVEVESAETGARLAVSDQMDYRTAERVCAKFNRWTPTRWVAYVCLRLEEPRER